ncbi:MerR family transcriptional regulator [Nocardia miyunensis]|uniref:MerR family transcriptional regulator n=1 Tax=Nocardia miyunensis TaxID=282684 RepID=UPI0008324FF5|nr:MerR family transcriptional regulator [Nocardia miyunensis]
MPGGPPPDAEVGYTVRAVADRLGVPTATLRSWNQRYRIGPNGHQAGHHRLYTEADITALERMVALVREGASPAAAAAAIHRPAPPRGDRETLLAAAFALDSTAVSDLLTGHLRRYGVVDTWNLLCRPAFADIVSEQERGVGCIDVEHLLSWCTASALQRVAPPPPGPSRIAAVLACTSGETHSLPLEVLRAGLAERGLNALTLGPDVPTTALVDAISRLPEPAPVVLWSQRESTALVSAVRACVSAGPPVHVGGPGWAAVRLPAQVRTFPDLVTALTALG